MALSAPVEASIATTIILSPEVTEIEAVTAVVVVASGEVAAERKTGAVTLDDT